MRSTKLSRSLGTDYCVLEYQFTGNERDARDRVRAFVDAEVIP